MINRFTLGIEGVTIPPEVSSKLYDQSGSLMICACISTLIEGVIAFVYVVVYDYYAYAQPNVTLIFSLASAGAFVFFLGWILSSKFNMHFNGFVVLITFIASILKFEEIFSNMLIYTRNPASYLFFCVGKTKNRTSK